MIPPDRTELSQRSRAQTGYITLIVALVIAFGITIMTIFAGRVSQTDLNISSNEVRTKESHAAAEEGIERAVAHVDKNRTIVQSNAGWTECLAADTALPCGDGIRNLFPTVYPVVAPATKWARFTVANATVNCTGNRCTDQIFLITPADAANKPLEKPVVIVTAEAQSDDASARAIVREAVLITPGAGGPVVDAPLIAPGVIAGSGTFDVVANPNVAGHVGVPLSAWSNDNLEFSGTSKSCHLGEYLSSDMPISPAQICTFEGTAYQFTECPDCECPLGDALTQGQNPAVDGLDILDRDGNMGANPDTNTFPPDLFEYVFEVPSSEYQEVKDQAQASGHLLTDCSTLGPGSSGLYWVTGVCEFTGMGRVGDVNSPVLVVVEDHRIKVPASQSIFGLLFAFSTTGTGTVEVKLVGGPTVTGAILSNINIDFGGGNFAVRYDACVLSKLSEFAGGGPKTAKLPGSWADFRLVN